MTIEETMKLLLGPLKFYASRVKGIADIVSDELHLWYYCYNSEDVPKLLLIYNGDKIRGDFKVAALNSMSDFDFDLVVSRNRGLQVDRAQSLAFNAGNAKPLFQIVEEARNLIRCINTPVGTGLVEWPIDYRGTDKWQMPGWIMDGYRVHFSVPNFLPPQSQYLNDFIATGQNVG
jgi:hypothetical protein